MPWKVCAVMNEKLRFVSRFLGGEKMSDLCREFGISRKTGYKIIDRYQEDGMEAFTERSRKPKHSPNKTPQSIAKLILDTRKIHPSWGAPKIRNYLQRKHSTLSFPVSSVIHVILERHGLVRKVRKRSHFKSQGTQLFEPTAPNDLWCADYKGQFKMNNKIYCYPLTVTDQFSRFILSIEAFESTNALQARSVFLNLFREYGLPTAIRTDNGSPFSANNALGLSKLAVWWLRHGIRLERIRPGHPQENGVHERMHLTLKQSMQIGDNLLQQQEIFDSFVHVFNHERPHAGIQQNCPGNLYKPSAKPFYEFIHDPDYPECIPLRVNSNGYIFLKTKRIFITEALAEQPVGVQKIEDGMWQVNFMKYPIGYFDEETLKFVAKDNPFKVEEDDEILNPLLPMSPE